ncbi:MAG: uracil-DNA glycosylase family protein [Candidatus Bathyarchaeia archaeon]|jgi:hypothetical protein
MTLSEEIGACQECRSLLSYGRLETDDKPYLVFTVDKDWKPPNGIVNVLFIAESPPWDRIAKQPYFYNVSDERNAGLRKEVLKHLNFGHLEEFRDKGYFLIDAIKCRLNKKDRSNIPLAVLETCSTKFLGREISVLRPKVIFVLVNSAKMALQGLHGISEFSDFKELINHNVTDEFDKMLCGYRVILCVYPGGQTRKYKLRIRRSFSKIA